MTSLICLFFAVKSCAAYGSYRFRPSCPDSLPVIGPAPNARHVTYAFGHGHLGLTQSAGTAQLVADLMDRKPANLDLTPYRADRFKTFF